jgi:ABC-type glycerol-3-phosphate transport system permease component
MLRRIYQWFKPEGQGIRQWKSWLSHSLIALTIALVLKLVVGAPGGYAMAILRCRRVVRG